VVLAFLLWFSLLGLPLLLWLRGAGGRRLSAALGRLAERRGAILLLALPMALLHVAVRGLPGEDHGWSELYYYFDFFLAGGVLLSDGRLAGAVRRDLVPALWLGSPASPCCSPGARSGSSRRGTGAPTRGRTRGWSRSSPCRPGDGW
jgi:hypothetical protein